MTVFADEVVDLLRSQVEYLTPSRQDLLNHIVGAGGTTEGYLRGGFTTALGLRSVLQSLERPIGSHRRILDFGCGSGRVIRWFRDLAGRSELFGDDIHGDAIKWCRENIDFASFAHHGPMPPLPFPDGHFDLIYGISVFTHLDEKMQRAWLEELRRLLRPEGLLLLSIHGEDKARNDLGILDYAVYRLRGSLYKQAGAYDAPTVEGLPDFYQVAFHTDGYIRRVWGRWFHVRAIHGHGPFYRQKLVVLEGGHGRVGVRPRSRPRIVDDPIVNLDTPEAASHQRDHVVRVSGWAFHPDGRPAPLDIWVDSRRVGTCRAEQERPDVAATFPAYKSALRSGFSTSIDMPELESGPHAVWVSTIDTAYPLHGSYFFKS
jgi:SAM-dependent methyltransferase